MSVLDVGVPHVYSAMLYYVACLPVPTLLTLDV